KGAIKAIDKTSVHRITSGQVVIDLQTAVKELVENSLDAGATNIGQQTHLCESFSFDAFKEVRFKQHGLKSIEVIDNGSGIPEQYHDSVALKHHTSKLSKFSDLTTMQTFGFRGEALSSLCALSEALVVNTTVAPPMGVSLEMDASGKVAKRSKIARQRGTTVSVTNLFKPLPVRRKEFERNVKREFGKALGLLNAYAMIETGVRFTVNNAADKGQKTVQLRTTGASSPRAVVSELWGPRALENIVTLDLSFEVDRDKTSLKRTSGYDVDLDPITVSVKGLISKFSVGGGRSGTDRQFFYVNGRPCNLNKQIQKSFNEVYRSFNATQAPFILADFIIPPDSCDINVSPDKRTIFLSSENNIILKLKTCLEETFAPSRSTYDVGTPQSQRSMVQATLPVRPSTQKRTRPDPEEVDGRNDDEEDEEEEPGPNKRRLIRRSSSLLTDGTGDKEKQNPTSHLPVDLSPASSEHRLSSHGRASMTERSPHVPSPNTSRSASSKAKLPSPPPSPPDPSLIAPETADVYKIDEDVEDSENDMSNFGASGDTPIVLDTSVAVWNRLTHSQSTTPAHAKGVQRKSGESDTLRGAWRSEGREKKKLQGQARKREDDLRNRFSGYARTGSQIQVVEREDEDYEDDDDDREDVEEEEKGQTEKTQYGVNGEETNGEDQLDQSDDLPPARSISSPVPEPVDKSQDNLARSSSPIDVDLDLEDRQSSFHTIDLSISDDGFDDSHVHSMVDESSSILHHEEVVSRPEVVRSSEINGGDITLRLDIAKISDAWCHLECKSPTGAEADQAPPPLVASAAGVMNTENDESAAKALSRIIDKKDFATMEIMGQFNLGFIVARRHKAVSEENGHGPAGGVLDDLFIVDQHAADEKYNFETLQQTTFINSQKLFKPQRMELTAADELVALENLDVLRRNGFEVEEAGEEDGVRPGDRLQLVAQPVSKSTTFDMKDMEELIHLMRDRPAGQMVRCSKARAMFAMRACRKSVMVGMPLSRHQMSMVVGHMGTMDQPWNCPHGRPTMRHLLDLQNLEAALPRPVRRVDWSKFLKEW
ncbi:hypothetical protein C0992_010743, partial [Termitomyces sp. T32_za158]